MTIYSFDNTFEGFLTLVFESYSRKQFPDEILSGEGSQGILFASGIEVVTDESKAEAVKEYRDVFASPYKAAEQGYIDEIIYPKYTRRKLIQALEMCSNKRKSNPPRKHGNIPL